MGVMKAEVKMGAFKELGATVDDMLENAQRELQQAMGAKNALITAQKKVEELANVVAHDLDDGEIAKLCEEPVMMAKYVNRMIMRAGGVVDNLATTAEVQRIQAVGAAASLMAVVKETKRLYDAEESKAQAGGAEELPPETGDTRPRGAAVSAAEDIAQRRADAKATKKAKSNGESEKPPKKKRKYTKRKTSKKDSKKDSKKAPKKDLVETPEFIEPDMVQEEAAKEAAKEAVEETKEG